MSKNSWYKVGLYFVGLGLFAAFLDNFNESLINWSFLGFWCLCAAVPLMYSVKKAITQGVYVLLTDHLVMLSLAYLIYFVFGTLLLSIGPQQQIDAALGYYNISPSEALRVCSVNSIGFGLLVITSVLSGTNGLGNVARQVVFGASKMPTRLVILFFLIVGFFSSVLVAMVDLYPGEQIIDGGYRILAKFSLIAIYLGIIYRGRNEKILMYASIMIAFMLSCFGLLLFNKTEVLLPLGILVIGFSVRLRSQKILILGLIGVFFIFSMIGNAVAWGRNTYKPSNENVILYRVYSLIDGFSEGSKVTLEGEYHPWARICYTPSQVAGMDFYDRGDGGGDFELIPWLFIPRFLAENKPIISASGQGVHTKITGNTGSSTGLGLFVSGYYNFGWIGLIAASMICGWIVAQTSRIAEEIFSGNVVLLFPFVFIGVYIAFRIDGNFVVDFMGLFVYLAMALYFIYFAMKLFGTSNER